MVSHPLLGSHLDGRRTFKTWDPAGSMVTTVLARAATAKGDLCA